MINLSLKLEDMQKIANEKWYVNMTISKRKEVGKYGDTHYVTENTWKPKKDELDTVRAVFPEADRPDISSIPW